MSERLRRIELQVKIPGPKCLEDELSTVEKTFLEKQYPEVLTRINDGCLWQDH